MAASATASGAPKLCYSVSQNRHLQPSKKAMGTINFAIHNPIHFSTTTANGSFPIRSLDPKREENENSTINNNSNAFTSQVDIEYLWKLLADSIVGVAVIKYGSVVFPEITRSNIIQALIMISTPVIVAVFLLIKQSRAEKGS